METVAVASSNLRSVGYDPATQVLQVTFVNGTTYAYRDVPATVYTDLLGAASKGRYFHQMIRQHYPFEKV
jgi:hypothetical protein